MKDKLTKRDWLLLVLIAVAVVIQGLLESAQGFTPNH
jgi:hypothetical protein